MPAEWIGEIKQHLLQGRASSIELARILYSAKRKLQRGEWSAMWRTGSPPFCKRKGEMLAAIGKGMGDLNAQTFAHLPSGWSILHELTKLPRQSLLDLIADETIHPKLTRAEAEALVGSVKGRRAASPTFSKAMARWQRLKEIIRENSNEWTARERTLLRIDLKHGSEELENEPGTTPGKSAHRENSLGASLQAFRDPAVVFPPTQYPIHAVNPKEIHHVAH